MNAYSKIVIYLMISFITINVSAIEKDVYFYHLTPKDGLSQMSILSIYQDEFGAIWFGTTEGLDRYNGSSIENFKPSDNNEISDNTIQYATGDQSGSLYLIVGNDLVLFDLTTSSMKLIKPKVDAIRYAKDRLWIAKADSIFTYNNKDNQFKLYSIINNHTTNKTTAILPISSTSVWLGTDEGLYKITDKKNEKIILSIDNIQISCLYNDSKQNLWVGTKSNGIYLIDSLKNIVHINSNTATNTISDNQIRCIEEDNLGNIWIGTFYGLNKYDAKLSEWQNYIHNNAKSYSISHSSIFSLFKDQQGTMWIGTYFGGVNYFNPETDSFYFYGSSSLNMSSISFPYVGSMIEDKHRNLWICTEGGELNCINLITRKISKYQLREDNKATERYNQKSIWYDKENDILYVGIHNGGLSIFDIKTKQTKIKSNFYPIAESSKIKNNTINHIEFYDGYLLLMTNIGLIKLNLKTNIFEPFSLDEKINEAISKSKKLTFHVDKNERLWIVTNGLMYIDLKSEKMVEFNHSDTDPHSICKSEINYIYESRSGNLYFSSMGSGIFKYNENTENFDNFTERKDGLISDFCYSISETPSGNLILLHNKGVSFLDPNDGLKNIFRTSSNFPIIGFNTGNSIYTATNNEIFIGGVNGLISFYENSINNKNKDYSIYFDKLFINNSVIIPGDNSNILEKVLPLSKKIKLKYSQNNFRIEFATSTYVQTTTHNYEFKLTGFDKEWIPTNSHIISYTNLNPGKYTLEVREIGNPNKKEELLIEIESPFYLSTGAYILYVVFALVIIYLIVRFFKWRTKIEESLKFEHLEKERIKELNQMKLRFFTNVSHEFRTPLTLIISHIDSLLIRDDLSQNLRNKIEKIARNTSHLFNLINELLDFRKQEQGFYKIRVKKIELNSYIKEIYNDFRDYATTKNIHFKFQVSTSYNIIYLDPEYFKKAIYNILSNAFKYTLDNGSIFINVRQTEKHDITIEIKDSGIGISPEHIDKIFDRFYQVEHRSSEVDYGTGTGIGLALTKDIVNRHGGSIVVQSSLNVGTIFTITLKTGIEHFLSEEIGEDDKILTTTKKQERIDLTKSWEEEVNNVEAETSNPINKAKPNMLIVDDNIAILDIITESFSKDYDITRAENGNKAYEIAKNEDINIIISDNIMPEMSGKELCAKIKNNILTSHIPFILLTAETSDSQIAEGYMFGADSYVTKPFNMTVLLSVCHNLIKSRQILYKKFRESDIKQPEKEYSLNRDNDLINKAITIIKENLSNPDFDMNKLGMELGYGRSKLYVRIKEETGMTPNEFTLNVKLKEAVRLLENNLDKNISQIAFDLGFSSTKYFSKCFKAFYGITPQDWRKNKNSYYIE